MAQDKAADIIRFNAGASSGEESAGAFLAAARATAGLSLAEVSEATTLKTAHIEAIEAMRPDLLPGMPYAAGFVKTYARFLGLDAEALALRFRQETAAAAPVSLEAAREGRASAAPQGEERAKIAWVFAIMAVALFFVWVLFQVLSGGERQDPLAAPERRVTVSATPARAPMPRPAAAQPVETPGDETAGDVEIPAAADEEIASGEDADAAAAEEPAAGDADVSADAAVAEEPAASLPAPVETRPAQSEPARAEAVEAQPDAESVDAAPRPRPRPLPRRAEPAPVVVESALTRSSAPAYPDRCTRAAKDVESVTVMFDVSAAGRAANARVVTSSNSCFNEEALRALDRWRFSPRTVDGAASADPGKTATLNFRK